MNDLIKQYINEKDSCLKTSVLAKKIKDDVLWVERENIDKENLLMQTLLYWPEVAQKLLNTKESQSILNNANSRNQGLLHYFLKSFSLHTHLGIFNEKYITKFAMTSLDTKECYMNAFDTKKEMYTKEGQIINLLTYLSSKINPSLILGSENELLKKLKSDLTLLNNENIVDLKLIEKYSLVFNSLNSDNLKQLFKQYSSETQAYLILYMSLQNDRKYLNLDIEKIVPPPSMIVQPHVLNTGDAKMIMTIFEKNTIKEKIDNNKNTRRNNL